jgi:Domain of unknown function (DUF4915)
VRVSECAAAGSSISVIDGYFNFTPVWQPPFVIDFGPDDRCHLNGMAFHDSKVRYVFALGETNTLFGWRNGMVDGGIFLMEVQSGRTQGASDQQRDQALADLKQAQADLAAAQGKSSPLSGGGARAGCRAHESCSGFAAACKIQVFV